MKPSSFVFRNNRRTLARRWLNQLITVFTFLFLALALVIFARVNPPMIISIFVDGSIDLKPSDIEGLAAYMYGGIFGTVALLFAFWFTK